MRLSILRLFIIVLCLYLCSKTNVLGNDNSTSTSQTEHCLTCHSKKDYYKTMENGEKINVFIDSNEFERSAHATLNCSSCHTNFAIDIHPKERFRSIEQFRKQTNLICRKCHYNEIKKIQIHNDFIKEVGESNLICTDCHSAHSIEYRFDEQSSETTYCLTCHEKSDNYMYFKNGEKMPLYVNYSKFEKSVHKSLSCSNCHVGFSKNSHPKRTFNDFRSYRLALSESCRRCHFDKYTRTLESIHNKILAEGRLEAPVCTDCHGSHNIEHFGEHRIVIAQRCQLCHKEIYDIYINSIHGKALIDMTSTDVPVCIDCHTAHDIKNPLAGDYRNNIPEMCSNCHSNKNIMDKYGISTDVVKTYLDDFHGKKISLYTKKLKNSTSFNKNIAVCTDCHGIHNIKSMRTLDTNTIKENLLKRCVQCHPNASLNFTNAWLSHYIPSLNHYPVLYIAIIIYKIFIPLLIAALALQILLHIWRYAINR